MEKFQLYSFPSALTFSLTHKRKILIFLHEGLRKNTIMFRHCVDSITVQTQLHTKYIFVMCSSIVEILVQIEFYCLIKCIVTAVPMQLRGLGEKGSQTLKGSQALLRFQAPFFLFFQNPLNYQAPFFLLFKNPLDYQVPFFLLHKNALNYQAPFFLLSWNP